MTREMMLDVSCIFSHNLRDGSLRRAQTAASVGQARYQTFSFYSI